MKSDEIILWVEITIAFALCCVMATSCKTQDCVPQIEYVKKDSIITRIKTDSVSVIERDSVFVDKAGDTIYLTRYKYVYKDRITNKVDTIYQDKVREVVQTQTIRYVPTYYKWCSWILWLIVIATLLYVAWRLFKRYYIR